MQDESAVDEDVLGVPAADRLLHSDPHDFAGLYIRHRASFTLHARRYLRDARDADEVVQEAFLRLFLALPELETELQALAYCRRTITNLCIDRFRAQARRPSLVDLDSAGAMDLAEDDPGDPVVRAEDAAMVRAALSLLSPLHRAALVKREIEEKPLPVIAEELEIPEESVKHVLFRARRALRRILASTSLAPGSDAELASALGRAGSGGLAAFILLLCLALGTGPDLRAVPVVGSDLPDLIPVEEIVHAVGDAVVVVADGVADAASTVTSGPDSEGPRSLQDEPASEPLPVAEPTSSPSAVASAAAPAPSAAAAPTPAPSTVPTQEPSLEPTAPATVEPTQEPTAEPTRSPTTEPSPRASSGSPSPKPSDGPARKGSNKTPPSPTPQPYVAGGGDEPELAEWEESDATYVEAYNPDGTPVL